MPTENDEDKIIRSNDAPVSKTIPANDNRGQEEEAEGLTQEMLKRRFSYDPEAGLFTRLRPGGRGQKAGSIAGVVNDNGYVRIWILGKHYRAYRLAFLYMTGRMPPPDMTVDHINRCKTDNRWSNLRLASPRENRANCGPRSDNSTGFKGVSRTASGRFSANIMIEGRSCYLGTFDTAAEAGAVYGAASNDAYGEFAYKADGY